LRPSFFFLSACSPFRGRTPEILTAPDAQAVLDALQNKNNAFKTFKGVGRIKIWNNGKIYLSERVAWVGSKPLSFRVEVLVSGRPLIKIASDGAWLYFRNAQSEQHPYGRIALNRENMERILQVPIQPAEFISLLTGGVPLYEHDYASLDAREAGEGYVLELEKKWQGAVQKIYLDPSKALVQEMELFDDSGFLIYRTSFGGFNQFDQYGVPSRVAVSTAGGRRFQLDISRYQTGIALNEGLFVLSPP